MRALFSLQVKQRASVPINGQSAYWRPPIRTGNAFATSPSPAMTSSHTAPHREHRTPSPPPRRSKGFAVSAGQDVQSSAFITLGTSARGPRSKHRILQSRESESRAARGRLSGANTGPTRAIAPRASSKQRAAAAARKFAWSFAGPSEPPCQRVVAPQSRPIRSQALFGRPRPGETAKRP